MWLQTDKLICNIHTLYKCFVSWSAARISTLTVFSRPGIFNTMCRILELQLYIMFVCFVCTAKPHQCTTSSVLNLWLNKVIAKFKLVFVWVQHVQKLTPLLRLELACLISEDFWAPVLSVQLQLNVNFEVFVYALPQNIVTWFRKSL